MPRCRRRVDRGDRAGLGRPAAAPPPAFSGTPAAAAADLARLVRLALGCAIPGLLPPVTGAREVLVDGGILDSRAFDRIVEAGYAHAREVIAAYTP